MPAYSVKDTELLSQVGDRLLEPRLVPPVPTTSQWALSDWTSAITEAQRTFLRETAVVVVHLGLDISVPYGSGPYGVGPYSPSPTGLAAIPGQEMVPLPQDTMDILRVAWLGFDGSGKPNTLDELDREDAWSLDANDPNWEVNLGSPPNEYTESLSPPAQIFVAHPPADIGQYDLLYVPVAAALSNTGVVLTVPDDFAPYLVWKALALLLFKAGEAHDEVRAEYCEARYQEGVALARALLQAPLAESVGG